MVGTPPGNQELYRAFIPQPFTPCGAFVTPRGDALAAPERVNMSSKA